MQIIGKIFRSAGLIVTIWSLFLAANVYADYEEIREHTFDVSSGGTMILNSNVGAIEVAGENSDIVKIEIYLEADTRNEEKAEKMFEDFEVEYEQDGDEVFVEAEYFGNRRSFWGRDNHLKVKFIVSVPHDFNLDLLTGGGSISVANVNGEVQVKTSGGGLDFENIKGTIEGKTSGGGIDINGFEGFCDIKTSGGGIEIANCKGEIIAKTSGGGIDIDELYGNIDASTSGGSIHANLPGQPADDCRLTTSGGSISVRLDKDVNMYLDASTSVGKVRTDFDVDSGSRKRKSSLRGDINDGGPELYLRSSAGSINIKEI